MKQVEMSVAEFEALPRNEQRVLIAKDVLAQLKAKVYEAKPGHYVRIRGDKVVWADSFREQQEDVTTCCVCEIGALITSAVRYANRLSANQLINIGNGNTDEARLLLQRYFSIEELAFFEFLFERSKVGIFAMRIPHGVYSDILEVSDHEARMTYISNVIIKLNGEAVTKEDLWLETNG